MKPIRTWRERCETHPAHQTGMVTSTMLQRRMQEEIDELREFHEKIEKFFELLKSGKV